MMRGITLKLSDPEVAALFLLVRLGMDAYDGKGDVHELRVMLDQLPLQVIDDVLETMRAASKGLM
jgi:hypothetical protein